MIFDPWIINMHKLRSFPGFTTLIDYSWSIVTCLIGIPGGYIVDEGKLSVPHSWSFDGAWHLRKSIG